MTQLPIAPYSPLALAVQQAESGQQDLLAELLANRAPRTQQEYAKDLKYFFAFVAQAPEPTPEIVKLFLQLDYYNAKALVLKYKAYLLNERKLTKATVNRRLAAIKSLVKFAYELGQCTYILSGIKSEKVQPYRDTTGIDRKAYQKILAIPDRTTLKGKRDYGILRLLWDNALRRCELEQANLGDLDLEERKLLILGKGTRDEKLCVTLSVPTVKALQDWLLARKELDPHQPLFIALDRNHYGHRLTGTAIYKLVRGLAKKANIKKHLSPHRIRHSGITAALDATKGDVRSVQKLSRHSDLNTLMLYDDNRQDKQGKITDLLADLV